MTREERERREYQLRTRSRCVAKKKNRRKKFAGVISAIMATTIVADFIAIMMMILNVEYRTMDNVAIAFIFMIIYFGIVIGLTDE